MKFTHLLLTFTLVSAFLTNPKINDHNIQLLQAQQNLGLKPDIEFIKKCDFHDYKLFSVMLYQQDLISVGLFDNVNVAYNQLEISIGRFQNKGHTQGDNVLR